MTIRSVQPQQLKVWLDQGQAVLVDVREPAEHQQYHIAGAHLLPLADVHKTALPAFKNRKLVMYCRSGRRCAAACEKLLAEDTSMEIYRLEGGIDGGTAAGLPVGSGKQG